MKVTIHRGMTPLPGSYREHSRSDWRQFPTRLTSARTNCWSGSAWSTARRQSDAEVNAYAEMPAMGSMQAMRAPADLVETGVGQFEGAVDLRMRGAWPLTVSIRGCKCTAMPKCRSTLRPIARGYEFQPVAGQLARRRRSRAHPHQSDAGQQVGTITIDSRRRQLIGLETDAVTHHDLVRNLRAIGNVTYDERRLKKGIAQIRCLDR